MSDGPARPAAELADPTLKPRWALERAVNELVRDVHGEDGFERRPAFPGATSTFRQPRPIPALHAVSLLFKLCATERRDHIRAARDQGSSWEEIAGALGVTDSEQLTAAQVAYELARGPVPRGYTSWEFHFRCAACTALVTDRGPYGSPRNNEHGHAPNCPRFAAEVAADAEHWGHGP